MHTEPWVNPVELHYSLWLQISLISSLLWRWVHFHLHSSHLSGKTKEELWCLLPVSWFLLLTLLALLKSFTALLCVVAQWSHSLLILLLGSVFLRAISSGNYALSHLAYTNEHGWVGIACHTAHSHWTCQLTHILGLECGGLHSLFISVGSNPPSSWLCATNVVEWVSLAVLSPIQCWAYYISWIH